MTSLLSGCAMCSSPFDECYAAFGGSRPRADMLAGRVGSKFVEAGAWAEGEAAIESEYESEIVSYGTESTREGFYDGYLDNEQFDVEVESESFGGDQTDSILESIDAEAPESTFDPIATEQNPLR